MRGRILVALLMVMLLAPAPGANVSFYPAQFSQAFMFEIAKGNVPGHSLLDKFGGNPSIDILDGFVTVWSGDFLPGGTQTYVPPTTARVHDLTSSSAADEGTEVTSGTATGGSLNTIEDSGGFAGSPVATDMIFNDTQMLIGEIISVAPNVITTNGWFNPSNGDDTVYTVSGDSYRIVRAASTGAAAVHVSGSNLFRQATEEFVILNGLGDRPTVNEYVRMNRSRVFGSGTGPGNAGHLTFTAQVDNTVSLGIVEGANQTLHTVFSIPVDQTLYLYSYRAALSKKTPGSAVIVLRVGTLNTPTGVNNIGYTTDTMALVISGTSAASVSLPFIRLPGGLDVWVEASVDSNDVGVAAGFQGVLVHDSVGG